MTRTFCFMEETGKRIRLTGKRNLCYKKFTKEQSRNGNREEVINNSVGYVLLDDLKRENTTQKVAKKFLDKVEDELNFYNKRYVIYKNELNGKLETEWITGYVEQKEKDVYKLRDSYIKGYLNVQSKEVKQNEPVITTVLLVSKKKYIPLLFIFLLMLLGAASVYALYSPKSEDVSIAESPMIEFAEDATEYDDTPVLMKETEQEPQNSSIDLNVFVNQSLHAGDTIPFANYSTNIDNLEFRVTHAGKEDVIYDTGIIAPGHQVKWNVSDTLGAGDYYFDIYLLVYPVDGTEASYLCFQRNFNVYIE